MLFICKDIDVTQNNYVNNQNENIANKNISNFDDIQNISKQSVNIQQKNNKISSQNSRLNVASQKYTISGNTGEIQVGDVDEFLNQAAIISPKKKTKKVGKNYSSQKLRKQNKNRVDFVCKRRILWLKMGKHWKVTSNLKSKKLVYKKINQNGKNSVKNNKDSFMGDYQSCQAVKSIPEKLNREKIGNENISNFCDQPEIFNDKQNSFIAQEDSKNKTRFYSDGLILKNQINQKQNISFDGQNITSNDQKVLKQDQFFDIQNDEKFSSNIFKDVGNVEQNGDRNNYSSFNFYKRNKKYYILNNNKSWLKIGRRWTRSI
eukprot:TRINITY_DN3074_c0_g3_i4.p1 TRINITY_DN3074_c0_g3~~TRINITY_DN3074_c0_g3_i4.p1  ORF type:complete len:318 (-),score=46.02 TRINITY_DN3074_c0_g3_i4:407-1360(-)